MIIKSILAGIIIGYIRKGNLKNLSNTPIRSIGLIFLSFALEAFIAFILPDLYKGFNELIWIMTFIQYGLLLIFIWTNRRMWEICFIGIGIILNFLVIMANKGVMPVSYNAINIPELADNIARLNSGKILNYSIMTDKTPLWFLGDIIYAPYITNNFISIGDLILSIGVILFIQSAMVTKK